MGGEASVVSRFQGVIPGFAGKWRPVLGTVAAVAAAGLAYGLTPFLEPAARTTSAIVSGAALLWITEAVPLHVTSLIVLAAEVVLLGLPGRPLASVGHRAFVASFFDPVLVLFLGGFALGAAISRSGLDQHLVHAVLTRVPATPAGVLGGTLGVTAFVSMWMSNTATAALMMAVILPVVARYGPKDPFRRALLLAVPFGANLGGIGTPIGTPPNVIALAALEQQGIRITFVQWMAMTMPLVIALLVFVGWVLLRWFPAQTASLAPAGSRLGPMSRQQRWVAAVSVFTALAWLTCSWHGVPEYVVALVPIILFFSTKTLRTADFHSLGWDVLMLMGGGLSLGFALQKSGLAEIAVTRLHLGDVGLFVATLAGAAIGAGVSTFISNTAAASLLVPVVAAAGGALGGPLAIAAAIGVSGAMALPISTPPNAIAFATGELSAADMARVGSLVGILAAVLVALTLWVVF